MMPIHAVIFCRQCRHALGTATPAQLTIGAAVFSRSVTMRCALCGAHLHWQPTSPVDRSPPTCHALPERSAG